jgi:imidazoleglycerol-phosphate dehydratase
VSPRKESIARSTKETDIFIEMDPDSKGDVSVETGIPFFDHILYSMAFHGGFNLLVKGRGDLAVDQHHLVEDTGIVLGQVFDKIVEAHGGVDRFGQSIIPMDDSLSEVVIDVCGRPYLVFEPEFPQPIVGSFDVSLIREFLQGLSTKAKINIHARIFYGKNSHHMLESLFKALGKALKQAYSQNKSEHEDMSAKGTIK